MNTLRCLQFDHESDNKLIEGICIDSNCPSPQRFWCVICLMKYHRECHRDWIIHEKDVIWRLRELKEQLNEEIKNSCLEIFLSLKKQIVNQLNKLQEFLFELDNGLKVKTQIDQIERILSQPFSNQTWNKTYDLLMSYNVCKQMNNIDLKIITKTLNESNHLLIDLEQWASNQLENQKSLAQQVIQSDTQVNNQVIIKGNHLIYAIDQSPSGKHIAYSQSNVIRVYDLEQKQDGHDMIGHKSLIWTIKYSPKGDFIASGCDNTICLWDSNTCAVIKKMRLQHNFVSSITFSPNGNHLISGSRDKTIRIFDLQNGKKKVQSLTGHKGCVNSVDYSPDGSHISSGSNDCSVRVWNAESLKEILQLNGHTSYVRSVKYSSDGQIIISGSADTTIRIWDIIKGVVIGCLFGHKNCINSIAFSPDSGLIVSGSDDRSVRVWSTRTKQCLGSINEHTHQVNCVAFSPCAEYIMSASDDKTLRIIPINVIISK